jgi:hypothetical protein
MVSKRESEVCTIYGQRGSGKSYGLNTKLREVVLATGKPVIMFDTLREHGRDSNQNHANGLVWHFETDNIEEFNSLIDELVDRGVYTPPYNKSVNILYTPQEAERKEGYAYFDEVCLIVKAVRNCIFAVDELDKHCELFVIPEPLKYLCAYGRHENIDCIFATRMPSSIPKAVSSNAAERWIYRTREANHLKYFVQCGIQKEILDICPHLQKGEHVVENSLLEVPVLHCYEGSKNSYITTAETAGFEIARFPEP